jgi:hypothetical protein
MRGKPVLTFLAALVVGVVVAVAAGRQTQALAQQPKKLPQWEYKVTTIPSADQEADGFLNLLAAGGWEYVGQVTTSDVPNSGGPRYTSYAFRRPKK